MPEGSTSSSSADSSRAAADPRSSAAAGSSGGAGLNTHPVFGDVSFVINQTEMVPLSRCGRRHRRRGRASIPRNRADVAVRDVD